MADSLFLKYAASDTGARPIPANTNFWESPAVVLGTADGNYTVGQPATIDVSPNLMTPQAYEIINVQVWVCDPTTVAGPSTALPPFQGAGPNQLTLTGFYTPPNPAQAISSVPTIQVTGFAPYPGISSLPGGHCCVIANCFGAQGDGTMDGVDLNTEAAANLPELVQADPHVAQHNIFADVSHPGTKIILFPFLAATPLRVGEERVTLTIAQVSPAHLKLPFPPHVKQLSHTRFAGLRLHISQHPVRSIGLRGATGRDCERTVELELAGGKSHVLTADIELSPQDRPGAVHAFDVEQRNTRGRVQGGFRLIAVAGR
jgi:hypothetical protein